MMYVNEFTQSYTMMDATNDLLKELGINDNVVIDIIGDENYYSVKMNDGHKFHYNDNIIFYDVFQVGSDITHSGRYRINQTVNMKFTNEVNKILKDENNHILVDKIIDLNNRHGKIHLDNGIELHMEGRTTANARPEEFAEEVIIFSTTCCPKQN